MYLLTYLPSYLHIYLLRYLLAYSLTHSACPLSYLVTYLLSHTLVWVFCYSFHLLRASVRFFVFITQRRLYWFPHIGLSFIASIVKPIKAGRRGPLWPCVYCLLLCSYCRELVEALSQRPRPHCRLILKHYGNILPACRHCFHLLFIHFAFFPFSLIQSVNLPCCDFFFFPRLRSLVSCRSSLRWRWMSIKGGRESSGTRLTSKKSRGYEHGTHWELHILYVHQWPTNAFQHPATLAQQMFFLLLCWSICCCCYVWQRALMIFF